nr:hypothetical protein JVH1_0219 [Rhodococcus sp. JVH1]
MCWQAPYFGDRHHLDRASVVGRDRGSAGISVRAFIARPG